MKFGDKLKDAMWPAWAEHYISYNKLKRILAKLEAKKKDKSVQVYQSPLIRSHELRNARASSPNQIVAALDTPLIGKASSIRFSSSVVEPSPIPIHVSTSMYDTPQMGKQGSYGGASMFYTPQNPESERDQFFRIIEEDIQRINSFYHNQIATCMQQIQQIQDENRHVIHDTRFHTPIIAPVSYKTTPNLPPLSLNESLLESSVITTEKVSLIDRKASVGTNPVSTTHLGKEYSSFNYTVSHNDIDVIAKEKILLALFNELDRLKLYVELNFIGFTKILKKFDKVTGEKIRAAFVTRLNKEPFFQDNHLGSMIQQVETMFFILSDGKVLSDVAAEMAVPEKTAHQVSVLKPYVLLFAFVMFLIIYISPLLPSQYWREQRCIALLVVIITLWVTEAMPFFVTALCVPILAVMMNFLTDNMHKCDMNLENCKTVLVSLSTSEAAKFVFSKMFDHTVSMVLGGFAISAAVSKFHFQLYLAHSIQQHFSYRPYLFILAFMSLGFVMCLFINNVAAPVLLLSVLLPIVRDLPRESLFAKTCLLGLAFSCNIGGMLTPVSSPQNTVSLSALSSLYPDSSISFIKWCLFAVPFGVVLLLSAWTFLILSIRPDDVSHIPEILIDESESSFSFNHYIVLIVSFSTVTMWCTFNLYSNVFGDLGIIALFPIVVFFGTGILSKHDFNAFSWNLIFLLAGGNVLGASVSASGLLTTIANNIEPFLEGKSEFVVVLSFCAFVAVVTTFVSHTVSAIIIMPLIVSIGGSIGHPQSVLAAAALMCSGSMALPMTSFPNMNSLLAEDDFQRPYLAVKDFLKYGGAFSVITFVLLVTFEFGLLKAVFG